MSNKDTLTDEVAKLLGKPPYDSPSNICWNDNYFYAALVRRYGEVAVHDEMKRQENK